MDFKDILFLTTKLRKTIDKIETSLVYKDLDFDMSEVAVKMGECVTTLEEIEKWLKKRK